VTFQNRVTKFILCLLNARKAYPGGRGV